MPQKKLTAIEEALAFPSEYLRREVPKYSERELAIFLLESDLSLKAQFLSLLPSPKALRVKEEMVFVRRLHLSWLLQRKVEQGFLERLRRGLGGGSPRQYALPSYIRPRR